MHRPPGFCFNFGSICPIIKRRRFNRRAGGVFSTIILINQGKLLFIFSLVSEKKRFIIIGRLERRALWAF